MNTFYLDPSAWDLTSDTSGNIALASDPYALAQDAASNIKTFSGEVFYDTSLGIPYFSEVLGYVPNVPLMKALFIAAAELVPEVTSATVYVTGFNGRVFTGQIQISSATGAFAAANF